MIEIAPIMVQSRLVFNDIDTCYAFKKRYLKNLSKSCFLKKAERKYVKSGVPIKEYPAWLLLTYDIFRPKARNARIEKTQ